jgi:hypothetical protein
VAAAAGRDDATRWLRRAQSTRSLLLPSERAALDRALRAVSQPEKEDSHA